MQPFPLGIIDDQFNTGQTFTLEDRRRHLSISGQTGTGKSTLIERMVIEDIHEGLGVAFIDPHGDSVQRVLSAIPAHRSKDVIYFDPTDDTHTVGINIFARVPPQQHHLAVGYFLHIFQTIWADMWGPRMQDIMQNAAYVLLEQPRPVSLVALPKLLVDDQYRAHALRHVTNAPVRAYFRDQYDQWTPTFRTEAIQAVLNKVDAFITNPQLRAILGQECPKVDFRTLIDEGKILLCNFSKGGLSKEVAQLLISLTATKISLAAASRRNIPEQERRLFRLYLDEAHNAGSADIPTMLSEARKYGLALILSTQTPSQYDEETRLAVLAACDVIAYRVTGEDVDRLKREFEGLIRNPGQLSDLPNFTMLGRFTVDNGNVIKPEGHVLLAFSPDTRRPGDTTSERVVRASRQRFARPRAFIERRLTEAYFAGVR